MRKQLYPTIVLLLLLPAAVSFGSFPVQSQKTTEDLKANFTLGLINPGNDTARVNLRARESPDYGVEFPDSSFLLEPTPVSRNPRGSGWYHLGDGRYVKVRYMEFRVEASENRSSNSLSVSVTVAASAGTEEGQGSSSRVVYVREHSFDLEVERKIEEDGGSSPEWIEIEDGNRSGIRSNRTAAGNGSESGKNYKPGGESKSTGESGANGTTFVLLLAVLMMAAYTYRVA
ncbi:MAG: hypothetical protein ABEJ07_00800 [Candidatus Nanohaloarchaea archaeon]